MDDGRSSSPESNALKPVARYSYPKSVHRSRQLSVSSSCTDASDRSTSPEIELTQQNILPSRPDVKYLRVHRVEHAHFMVLVFPSTTSGASVPVQRRTKVYFGAELHRLLCKPPNLPKGTLILPYRVIPLVGPNAVHLRRPSTSSTSLSS
ncbi:hypothetical protein EIP91_012403 [Steccherinum ochraceum]|uniref:Uncharacterized protein n=1 Tax=Steccherinum ochraceum TaxID=92696 RepID=A0A4R0RGP1_9APHY|nr:hypothetical protein EIP91_012403 [Steccherinum ochraceum]